MTADLGAPPLDLGTVSAHIDELRSLLREPFPETTMASVIRQARVIELGQALQLADALLALLRETRAALRVHVCHRNGYLPACVEYAALHGGAHRPECAQSVAVLGAARDGRTTRVVLDHP